jgi:ABC-type glycerol-3-phosphate transport system permease component
MLKSSVSTPEDLVKLPPVYFPKPTLNNFRLLAEQVPLLRYVCNSLVFAVVTTTTTVFVCFLAAYAFARIPFPGSGILLWVLVLSMALPEIATIIPLYQMLKMAGLLDSLTGLIIVMTSVLSPFTVWVFVPFIQQIPRAVEEAAIIDGAGLWRILWRIVFPISAPAVATMAVINFVNVWNNLLYPLAFSATLRSKCLSVAITEVFQAQVPWGKPWHLISALGITMLIPVMLLIVVSQRAIVRGLTRGAIK